LVLGYLNQEKYGIWITLTTVVNWIRLLDFGMGGGMRNKLAESISLKQYEKGRMYISTTYGILGSMFLLALLVFFLINPRLNWQGILNTTMFSPSELISLTNIVVSFIILGFILQPITLVYAAHGNSAAGGFIQLVISFLSLILIWFASRYAEKGNVKLLAWIVTGLPVLIYFIVTTYTFLYKYPYLKPSFILIRVSESENLIKLSAQFFVVGLTSTIIYSSIPFVVAQLFSPNEVTVFNIANSIFNLPLMFIGLVTAPVLPLVTQAYARQDYAWIRSMLRKMNYFSWLVVAGVVLMILISPFIYHIWIGDKVEIPFHLSVAIGIYTIINVINAPFSTFISGTGKVRILTILAPVGIGMFIGFSILLSRLLNDIVGVSIALSLTSIVALFVLPVELYKHIGRKNRPIID
jgi:O-antigen/teichoic acid export membrane protein